MRCCRATPSCGDEDTSVRAARSGLCGWGGVLMCNVTGKQVERWANGNGSVAGREHKPDDDVAAQETVYRHNNNNCSSSSHSSADGIRSAHCVLQQPQLQEERRWQNTNGWRSSNRRYSLLRCILCNLKQSRTSTQQQQQQQQQQYVQQRTKAHEGQLLQMPPHAQRSRQAPQTQSQPQAIVVAVVVGASIDHQIQQQEPQLSDNLNAKQHRNTTAGSVGDGRSRSGSLCGRSNSDSSYNCDGEGCHIGGSEALL